MTHRQFLLPDLGEGLPDAEIVRWLVSVGDTVTVNQPLVEVETAKALVEVPSPFAGLVVATHGAAGKTLAVGLPLVTIDTADVTGPGGSEPGDAGPGDAPVDEGGRTPVLVGYGPRANGQDVRSRRGHRGTTAAGPTPTEEPPGEPAGIPPSAGTTGPAGTTPAPGPSGAAEEIRVPNAATHPGDPEPGTRRGPVLAKPPVRKLARDLGIDLATLVGTGPNGTISRSDVEAARSAAGGQGAGGAGKPLGTPGGLEGEPGQLPGAPEADQVTGTGTGTAGRIPTAADALLAAARYDPASRTRRIPVTGVRRATARAMVDSAFGAPHVTEFITVDVTDTMAARDRLADLPELAGVKLTPLLFAANALLVAARRHPLINASWDGDAAGGEAEIVVHDVVNLGIAVASPRGLLVPNIPDAGSRGLGDLARALHELVDAARSGRVSPADLRGGTITITNIGSLGVDTGTPILNPGEAAILALGAVRQAPWVHQGELAVRTVAHLALSFDHRIVDGQLGSAVLADVAAMLADPVLALAWR